MNRKLRPQVETVFLLPDAPLQCISSTLVREISKLGGDFGQMRGLFPGNRAKKWSNRPFTLTGRAYLAIYFIANQVYLSIPRIFINRNGR